MRPSVVLVGQLEVSQMVHLAALLEAIQLGTLADYLLECRVEIPEVNRLGHLEAIPVENQLGSLVGILVANLLGKQAGQQGDFLLEHREEE